MEAPDDLILEKALEKAEEAARRVIERALGTRALNYNIQLSIVYDERGIARLMVDVSITRPRAGKNMLEEVVEAAIRVAEEVFESEIAEAVGNRTNRRIKEN